jgi:hypothetical protein
MITFVCWLWTPIVNWKRDYTFEQVNALERMLKQHVSAPHRLICITDDPTGINCETFPIWNYPTVETKPGFPNCYRRLRMFSQWATEIFGDRIVSIDLDCLIRKDITSLFTGGEDFRITKGQACLYNGSLWMLKTGSRKQVWDDFDPALSPRLAYNTRHPVTRRRFFGSDQAWLSYKLPDEKVWTQEDGVYHFRTSINHLPIPEDCRIIFFAGRKKPWHPETGQINLPIHQEYARYLSP